MVENSREFLAILITILLVALPVSCGHRTTPPATPLAPVVFEPLREELQKSYLELFRTAPRLEYSQSQIDRMRAYLGQAQSYCVGQFKTRADEYSKESSAAEKQLASTVDTGGGAQVHTLHCRIQNSDLMASRAKVLADHAIPTAYDNERAKLELIEKWPGQLQEIKQEIANGSYRNRRWGDVRDIGFREIEPNQKDDIKAGQDAVKQMREAGLMPKTLENPAVTDYVTRVAERVAAHSDLHVPLHVTVLNSKEVNAFALPGGYLFVERGLLEAADDESQLAGVIAHEIAHDAARHGHKLMVRGTIESVFFQAAQVAAIMLTGGLVAPALYYALQYGFYGLGLVLNLNLLGVSREYELQADQLGIQYTWAAGYDPTGFIRFFDKMATREGYVTGISWFHSHPPFYTRMVDAQREIMFLPAKPNPVVQTAAFGQMKTALKGNVEQAEDEKVNGYKPSLKTPEPNCPAPPIVDYKPGQPIETLCALPPRPTVSQRP